MMDRWHTWVIARLVTILLLVTIGVQAVPSFAATFKQEHGSAFSASTSDVALLRLMRSEAASPLHVLPPSLPPVSSWLCAAVITIGARNAVPIARLYFGAPSLDDISNVPRAPRPPPASSV